MPTFVRPPPALAANVALAKFKTAAVPPVGSPPLSVAAVICVYPLPGAVTVMLPTL